MPKRGPGNPGRAFVVAAPLQRQMVFYRLSEGGDLYDTMNWSLHRQVVGRLGPLLVLAFVSWLVAAYFYFDPFVALGVLSVSKASWGVSPHEGYLRAALTTGLSMTLPIVGPYIILYMRLHRGERVRPAPWWNYALIIGGAVVGLIFGFWVVRFL